MHVRLRRRWLGPKIPILSGGWYPAEPFPPAGIIVQANGEKVCLSASEFEVSESPRYRAVIACDLDTKDLHAVCPAGHHIDFSPTKPRAMCEKCGREFDLEA